MSLRGNFASFFFSIASYGEEKRDEQQNRRLFNTKQTAPKLRLMENLGSSAWGLAIYASQKMDKQAPLSEVQQGQCMHLACVTLFAGKRTLPPWDTGAAPGLSPRSKDVSIRVNPRFSIGTHPSVRLAGCIARRNDDADCILLGGATKLGSLPDVQLGG